MVLPIVKKLVHKALGRRRIQSLRRLVSTGSIHTQPISVCRPESGKIAVLAPHMDDEVLGCGGTIAMHAKAGADVTVIFLTDGRYGGSAEAALPEAERYRGQLALVDIRKEEARCAGAILGVRNMLFLDAEDGRLRGDEHLPKRLRNVLQDERPDIVYLPSFLDNHPDHRAASDALLTAVRGAELDFECRDYEVWTPLFPNLVVEIDAMIELKKRALACYRSQLAHMDFLHTSIGLNAFRSSAVGCKEARFVEAFFGLPLAEFRRFHRAKSRVL